MTKKRKLLLAITALLLLSAAFVLFVPRRCLPNGCKIEVYRVSLTTVSGSRVDVTEGADVAAIVRALPDMRSTRCTYYFAPYSIDDTQYEIDGMYSLGTTHETFHIILGDINYYYISGDKGGFRIKDSEYWLDLMRVLVPNP